MRCNKYVYIKDTKNVYVILCLYVNDILIVGSNDMMNNLLKIYQIQDLTWKVWDWSMLS